MKIIENALIILMSDIAAIYSNTIIKYENVLKSRQTVNRDYSIPYLAGRNANECNLLPIPTG